MALNSTVARISLTVIALVVILVAISVYLEYRIQTSPLIDNASDTTHLILPEEESISVLVIGDSGSGTKNQRDIAIQMERRCRKKIPEAILHVGDVFYPTGVTSTDDEQWETKLFGMYTGDCLENVPIFPVLGNHDYEGDVASWLEMSKNNTKWIFPARHYSIEFPNVVTFYAIDTQHPVRIEEQGIPDFGEASTPWKFAFGHHPLTSQSTAGGGHQGISARSLLVKRLLCNRVDGYMAGHTHSLELDHIEDCNMMHFISGAGGAALYPIREEITAEFARSEYGFLELEFFPEKLNIRFFNKEGQQFDKQVTRDPQ